MGTLLSDSCFAGKERCRMFEKGEYIVYGTSGVCQVEDITTMEMGGVAGDRLFYVLVPSNQKGGKIFTPVDNKKIFMRRVMNEEEASRLIDEILGIEELWISNEKLREAQYKECLKSCDCKEWIRIIKTLYLRKRSRSAQGKRITSTDEKYLRMAQEYLYSELEIPLGIPRARMEEYISERIQEQKRQQNGRSSKE